MKEGLLWYCDNPGRDLADKIGQAAQRHEKKYGVPANMCYVHPSALSDGPRKVGNMRVAALHTVLVHHFFIGVEGPRKVEAVQERLL
jgi:hypothetical protein